MTIDIEALKKLREPFPPHQIGKLPKPTKQQTDEVKADFKKGVRCEICGGWHHPKVVHLDYVGHAALTDRFLSVDPEWNWEPVSFGPDGSPVLDKDGGMWIRLTICGVTRLGYGDAQGKSGADAMKERIGDALRNGAMRFGAALDLWHKGDLHVDDAEDKKDMPENRTPAPKMSSDYEKEADKQLTLVALESWYKKTRPDIYQMTEEEVTKINLYVKQLKEDFIANAESAEKVDAPENKLTMEV